MRLQCLPVRPLAREAEGPKALAERALVAAQAQMLLRLRAASRSLLARCEARSASGATTPNVQEPARDIRLRSPVLKKPGRSLQLKLRLCKGMSETCAEALLTQPPLQELQAPSGLTTSWLTCDRWA